MILDEQDANSSLQLLHDKIRVYQYDDDIYVEFHTEKYPDYEFSAENHSLISLEYDNEWFITIKEPLHLEFIDRSNLAYFYDENLLE